MYFLATPRLLPKNSRTKFSRQTEKASANFSGAKTRGAHFSADSIFAPGLTGQQSPVLLLYRAPYLPAASFITSGACRPTNTSRRHSFHTSPHNPPTANLLPSGLAGRRLTYLQPPPPTPSSQPFSSFFFIANILPASTLRPFLHCEEPMTEVTGFR